jgi:hypothetical protein
VTKEKVLEQIEALTPLLSFIFSWILMLPIGVIISGIFLGALVPVPTAVGTRFVIPLLILKIEATGGEVVIGFYAYLLTFSLVLVFGGTDLYQYIKVQSSLDPGHFNSLCAASAVLSALWTSVPFFASLALRPRRIAPVSHTAVLESLTTAANGGASESR